MAPMDRRGYLATLATLGCGGCLRLTAEQGSPASPGPGSTPATVQGQANSPATTTSNIQPDSPTASEMDSGATTEPADLPLGLSADGPDPLLAEVHRNVLMEDSFEIEYQIEAVSEGHYHENYTGKASDKYRYQINHDVQNNLIRFSQSNRGKWWREIIDGDEIFGHNKWAVTKASVTHEAQLKRLLRAGDYGSPQEERQGNTTVYTISADSIGEREAVDELRLDVESVETFSAEGAVTSEGVIRTLQVEFQWIPVSADTLRKHRFLFRTVDTGISLSPPEWLSTAQDRAPSVNVSLTDDRNYVIVSHESGNPFVSGSQFVFRADGEQQYVKQIDSPVQAGDTAYLFLENDELQVNLNGRPTDASPTEITNSYEVFAEVGSAPYFGPVEIG